MRLTGNKLKLRPKSYIVKATISTYDYSGKSISRSFDITAGYYFDPGDTLENSDVFIAPAGEKPDFTVSISL